MGQAAPAPCEGVDQALEGEPVLAFSVPDDNDDPTLPARWRGWWRFHAQDLELGVATHIHISRIAWSQQTRPMYSYDGRTWQRFASEEVCRPTPETLHIRKVFTATSVTVAPYQPYDLGDLERLLLSVSRHPAVMLEPLWETPHHRRPLWLVHVTDPDTPERDKRRVWVHARTHPGEVGSSMVAEGLLRFLLGDAPQAQVLRRQHVFSIVVVANPDGVACGNYRTTPAGENLEVLWRETVGDGPLASPVEVALLQQKFLALEEEGPRFVAALNLHATHSEPFDLPFFVMHFGPRSLGYTSAEAHVWSQQAQLATAMAEEAARLGLRTAAPDREGGRRFLDLAFPETWFWSLREGTDQEPLLAVTFETVYGRARQDEGWVTVDDQQRLGEALGRALGRLRPNAPFPPPEEHLPQF